MTTIQRNFQARKYIAGPCPHLVSGILRALKAYPDIEFINDTEAEQFKVIIRRPEMKRRGGEG